ncbi:MAG TPA: cation:proton antiporter, partial [Kofleriaceae bacterium]|nr:cation:proton antiporter [Kofleriaceae bacterium]
MKFNLLLLILQIGVILIAARAVGLVFRKLFHQPQVVGEMAAGIFLGPSLLGWAAPDVSAFLFPPASLPFLSSVSQVGLLIYMFMVGLEFDTRLMRGRGHAAVVTSHVSIIAPFFLGSLVALFLYPRLSDESVSFTGFCLFMGAAMSVTAFPVLARILSEQNLTRTRVGAVTIACAAVDDITAWTILAVVVAIVRASSMETPLWLTLVGSAAYLVLMVAVVRPGLRTLERFYKNRGRLTQDMVGVTLLLVLASAWTTEWIGIHALFGAFAMGAIMPKRSRFVHDLIEKIEDLTVVLLLPIFFAFAGLKASIGLVVGAEMWLYAGLVLLVAVTGKFGGSTIAARLTGLSWRESGALGILMNTRGLMELVILTIGLEIGVISPALYTMMVLMALITTAMTTPMLELIYPPRLIREASAEIEDERPDTYTVVVPVSLPSAGPGLLEAARLLVPPGQTGRIYALHLERPSNASMAERQIEAPKETVGTTNEALAPLLAHAEKMGVQVRPISFVSRDIPEDIRDVARVKGADLVLMGWHKPVVGQSILGGTVSGALREMPADLAILVQRGQPPWKRILVPYRDMEADRGAIELASRLAGATADTTVTILHVVSPGAERGEKSGLGATTFGDGVRLQVIESDDPLAAAVAEAKKEYDLIVVGASPTWGMTPSPFGARHEGLARASSASLLVVRQISRVDAAARRAARARRASSLPPPMAAPPD